MAHKGRKDTGSLKVEHPLTGPASACRLPSDMFPAQTRGDKDRLIFSVRLEKERGTADTIGVCVGWLWQHEIFWTSLICCGDKIPGKR